LWKITVILSVISTINDYQLLAQLMKSELAHSTDKVLYVVRQCQSSGQQPDAPLTHEGKLQAALLSDFFSGVPLLLKHFNEHIGFTEWQGLTNPDIYKVVPGKEHVEVKRVWEQF
jgi:hypothetical protein